jgi:hypothetical protein
MADDIESVKRKEMQRHDRQMHFTEDTEEGNAEHGIKTMKKEGRKYNCDDDGIKNCNEGERTSIINKKHTTQENNKCSVAKGSITLKQMKDKPTKEGSKTLRRNGILQKRYIRNFKRH